MPQLSLPDRVERRVDGLARAMVAEFVSSIAVYRTLPPEQLQGEIHGICVTNLRSLFTCLREGRPPAEEELSAIRASAARRAEERVPLEAVLDAYMTGARIGWGALRDEARPEETDELTGHVGTVLDYLRAVTAAVTSAWVEEQQAIVGEERDARRALTEALLTGDEPSSGLVERAGVRPADRYRAVAFRFDLSADERDMGVSATVAGRRKVRRVVQALEDLVGGPVLTLLDANGGAAALPVADVADLRDVVEGAARAEVWIAHSDLVRLPALPAAWDEAREVRRLITMLGRLPGTYAIDDVILEFTITSDPAAMARLNRLLAPIAERDDLIDTLEAWFDADFDRRMTARDLSVHPNTVDYRLRRISELLGHDVASAFGMQLLGAALLARRLAP